MKKIAVVDPNDATQFYATAAVGLKSRSQVVIFECHTCSGNWLLLLENETQQSSGFLLLLLQSTILLTNSRSRIYIRVLSRNFDRVGNETTYGSCENKHFLLSPSDYEQPPRKTQNSDFQSNFSVGKIDQNSPIFFL